MNVHLERRWNSLHWAVTFYERVGADRLAVLRPDGDSWRQELVGATQEFPPSLTLPDGALEALLQEAGKVLPATHATERHLDDAVKVRDRLLELVEEGWAQ